ncbi:MAG: DivIVA domain-containing protein [bacterium]
MELSPIDVTHKEFARGFRGYSVSEVKEFLGDVAACMESLVSMKSAAEREAEELKEQLAKYLNLEDTLQKTLVLAQRTSEEIVAAAKKEAELILERAGMDEKRLRDDFARVKAEKEDFEIQFQTLLETFLKRLRSGGKGEKD